MLTKCALVVLRAGKLCSLRNMCPRTISVIRMHTFSREHEHCAKFAETILSRSLVHFPWKQPTSINR